MIKIGLKLIGICEHMVSFKPLMTSSDSDFNISSKLVISLQAAYVVLSSPKLARLTFFMSKNKSFLNKLSSIGPSIEPCGTPETNVFNRLSMLYILTFCFLLFK